MVNNYVQAQNTPGVVNNFPKGTDFSSVSEEELQDVINEINDRPRKILGYLTAKEKFYQLLGEEVKGCD